MRYAESPGLDGGERAIHEVQLIRADLERTFLDIEEQQPVRPDETAQKNGRANAVYALYIKETIVDAVVARRVRPYVASLLERQTVQEVAKFERAGPIGIPGFTA